MASFTCEFLERIIIPPKLIQTLRLIGEHKGRQDLYRLHAPEKLENLCQVELVQSVESSNRIEGITAPAKRIEELKRRAA